MPPGSVLQRAPVQLELLVAAEAGGRAGGGLGGHEGPRSAAWRSPDVVPARSVGRALRDTGRRVDAIVPQAANASSTRHSSPRCAVTTNPAGVAAHGCEIAATYGMPVAMARCAAMGTPRPEAATSYWLRDPAADRRRRPAARRRASDLDVDVAIVGGRLHRAVDGDRPDRHGPVAARRGPRGGRPSAFGASGRNGGFCEASLTHGLANGIKHFPDELRAARAEGIDNLRGLIAFTRDARHRLRPRGDRDARPGRPALPGRGVPGLGRRGRRVRRDARLPGPRAPPRTRSTPRSGRPALYRPPGRDILVDPAEAVPRARARRPRARRARSTRAPA